MRMLMNFMNRFRKVALAQLGDKRLGALVVALILAGLALRLAWGLHGPEAFGFGFAAWAQEESDASCPDPRLVREFDGKGDQLTDTFDTEAGFFRVTQDLRGNDGPEPYLNTVVLDEDGSPAGDAFQSGEGTRETFVEGSPGSYYLDIDTAGDVDYTVTVEQCEDDAPSTSTNEQDQRPTTGQTRPLAQRSPISDGPGAPDPSPIGEPRDISSPDEPANEDEDEDRGELLRAGGPEEGPVPAMPDGECPPEFPTKQGGACYR
jgi:hypothetical protein